VRDDRLTDGTLALDARRLAGDAALVFDPESPRAIADAVATLLGSAGEAARLRTAGRERAGRFSWRETARGTIAAYERALA